FFTGLIIAHSRESSRGGEGWRRLSCRGGDVARWPLTIGACLMLRGLAPRLIGILWNEGRALISGR
ncbi:hypothetical protein ACVQK1_13815, partial [Edwardsiella tarda]